MMPMSIPFWRKSSRHKIQKPAQLPAVSRQSVRYAVIGELIDSIRISLSYIPTNV